MKIVYRHVYTVVVEDSDNFNPDATLTSIRDAAERNARLNTILVKHGGIEPKPVRSSHVTTTHFEVEA